MEQATQSPPRSHNSIIHRYHQWTMDKGNFIRPALTLINACKARFLHTSGESSKARLMTGLCTANKRPNKGFMGAIEWLREEVPESLESLESLQPPGHSPPPLMQEPDVDGNPFQSATGASQSQLRNAPCHRHSASAPATSTNPSQSTVPLLLSRPPESTQKLPPLPLAPSHFGADGGVRSQTEAKGSWGLSMGGAAWPSATNHYHCRH
ncbi:hypothetical protein EDB81DRAFT_155955 [Dactylonectria macrodidyma]|uniref:Uncharacterized protein n=1 Tax=Dactylonectria macrodidyma TaxID=307937 RepID=A0A9P9JKW1_9HYPO|nr:hypothetical protein EDB81DRAFT_155955 [Dactylonectria macrodidyma]